MALKSEKIRPAIIVNDDGLGILPLRVIVPITDWKDHYSTALWIIILGPDITNNLTKHSGADCFQVKSVSQDRFVRKLGQVADAKMIEIEKALALILRIRK